MPEHLERIEIEHDLDEAQKACPACGNPRCRIGAEVSEQLEYFPAHFKVLKHVRPKYACTRCDSDGVFAGGDVTEVACWAHARRKFYDAQDSDGRRAAQMLALVGELYALEREAKELSDAVRLAVRAERSVPVLSAIKAWLDAEGEVVLPRSPLAAAIGYAKNQWAALGVYTTQGFLNIDNNAAERALKRVAIGRKNWLFAGYDAAALNHARLWTLIASADRHALDPQRYLTSVLAKLPFTPPAELTQFLPDVWKRENAAEPLAPDA